MKHGEILSLSRIAYDVLEIHAKGPRGGKQEWTVHFNRKGEISYGFGHHASVGYVPAGKIPNYIVDAARGELRGHYSE